MKVILATDGTRYGEAAIKMLSNLNLQDGDQVNIVCVVDLGPPAAIDIYGGYLPDVAGLEEAGRESAEKIIAAARSRVDEIIKPKKVAVAADVQFGSPESRIVETAEQIGADLIIVGSHGYKQWERLLLGSVSSSVAHHAPCSVLIVRCPE